MSNLGTIIEFIHNLCLENVEMNNMLNEIGIINRENTKLEYQLEELDREQVRLQIELYNFEMITSDNNISVMNNFHQTSLKIYNDAVELRTLIEQIDFTKILQCYHMEMEANCRKEWQPIQECSVRLLNYHEKMEQRYIVQKYRQAETNYREAEEDQKNHHELKEKSFKQSLELIQQAKEWKNKLIIILIKGSKDLNEFKAKREKLNEYEVYIECLRTEKINIQKQLENNHMKAFNPILNEYSNHNLTLKLEKNTDTCSFIIPKLPSFTDILKSFNQTEKITNITAIENTTKYCIKSILHTSSSSQQSITTKQTKNVHFKMQLEEYQEEMPQNIYNTEIESETDLEIEIQPAPQTAMEINVVQGKQDNAQEIKDLENNTEIEIVDLLTPGNDLDLVQTIKENQEGMDTNDYNSNKKNPIDRKPLIEIQECIIFKTPFPIEHVSKTEVVDKENISNNIMANISKQFNDSTSPSTCHSTENKEMLRNNIKSFYEELSNISSSAEASPKMMPNQKNINEIAILKDFEKSFNGNKDFLFAAEDPKAENKNHYSDIQDFLDFDLINEFTFDSDDNTKYNAGNMDFM